LSRRKEVDQTKIGYQMSVVAWLKAHAPEAVTVAIVALAIVLIELRRAPIHFSPAARERTTAQRAAYPRVMHDSSGATLVIESRPQRIVSQTLGSDEVLFGVCAADQVVGVSERALDEQYSNVADRVRKLSLPQIKNVEDVVELRPDIVFVASYSSAEQVELLRSTGTTVFRLSNFDQIDGIMSNIRAIGYAVGEDRCADDLVAQMKSRLQEIASATAHRSAPRVMEYSTSGYTSGAHTLTDEMFRVVGARNLAAEHGVKGDISVSAEVVALWQPDFIVAGAPHGESDQVLHALMANPAIANSPAGRSGQIIVIDDRFLLCVSQYIVPAIEQLADGLYGRTKAQSSL
jgi:iron complex transport system substrate-binding protein